MKRREFLLSIVAAVAGPFASRRFRRHSEASTVKLEPLQFEWSESRRFDIREIAALYQVPIELVLKN